MICPVKFNLEVMYWKALATVATGNTEQLQSNPLEMLCDSLTWGLSLFWGSEQPWHMLAFLYEVGSLSLCSFLSGFSRSPALLLSSSDQSGTARHLITVLRMVCKWKLKNCSFLEFFPSIFVGQGWLRVTGTVETQGTRWSITQQSGLSRARLGGVVESWWRSMGMVRPLSGKAQWQWESQEGGDIQMIKPGNAVDRVWCWLIWETLEKTERVMLVCPGCITQWCDGLRTRSTGPTKAVLPRVLSY